MQTGLVGAAGASAMGWAVAGVKSKWASSGDAGAVKRANSRQSVVWVDSGPGPVINHGPACLMTSVFF